MKELIWLYHLPKYICVKYRRLLRKEVEYSFWSTKEQAKIEGSKYYSKNNE